MVVCGFFDESANLRWNKVVVFVSFDIPQTQITNKQIFSELLMNSFCLFFFISR